MLKRLKSLNPEIQLFGVEDKEFSSFGRVIDFLDTKKIIEVASKIEAQGDSSSYVAKYDEFEKLPIAKEIKDKCFGTLPTQIGYCWGHSNFLNAAEWHTSSEINISITPLVLFLGHVWDIEDKKIDSSSFKAFYLPKGTAVEIFSTSLHFCPCEVSSTGFGCVVALPQDTNTPLAENVNNSLLFRKNKWIIAHEENEALKSRGVICGITGVNYEIKY